jgi:hypothetical protein
MWNRVVRDYPNPNFRVPELSGFDYFAGHLGFSFQNPKFQKKNPTRTFRVTRMPSPTDDDPRPTFVSVTLTQEERESYWGFFMEYRDRFELQRDARVRPLCRHSQAGDWPIASPHQAA